MTTTDRSAAMARNLELARRYTVEELARSSWAR